MRRCVHCELNILYLNVVLIVEGLHHARVLIHNPLKRCRKFQKINEY